jgi:hypothetical protein
MNRIVIIAVSAIISTTALSQSQQPMPQGWCDGEPNKADCVILFQI